MKTLRVALLIAVAAILPACGGGSSSPQNANTGPFVASAWFTATRGAGMELFAANEDGSIVVPISLPHELSAAGVSSFKRSPDGRFIAFVDAPFAPPSGRFLFVVPADGSIPILVNYGTVADGLIGQFDWSPDSTKIAYIHDGSSFGTLELHVVNFDGTGDVKLSGSSGLDRDVTGFSWAPNGSRIVYLADEDTNDLIELYTVMVDGTGRAKVNGTLDPFSSVGPYAWAPDSSRIAYMANQGDPGFFPLYTALPDGSGDVRVSPLAAFGELGNFLVETPPFRWAPDSSRLAYIADQEVDGRIELFTVLPDGTGNTKVSGSMVAGGGMGKRYAWAPDSSKLCFIADRLVDEDFELFTVAPDGTGLTKISGPLVGSGDVIDLAWSPDSSRVAYAADQTTGGTTELYVSPATGGGNVKLNGVFVAGGNLVDFAWSPDGMKVAYIADQNIVGTVELFVSNRNGSGKIQLSGPMIAAGGVQSLSLLTNSFAWSSDSASLIYSADQEWDEVVELYRSPTSGASGNVKLSGPSLALGGDVFESVTK